MLRHDLTSYSTHYSTPTTEHEARICTLEPLLRTLSDQLYPGHNQVRGVPIRPTSDSVPTPRHATITDPILPLRAAGAPASRRQSGRPLLSS